MTFQDTISILWLEDEPRQIYPHIKRLEDIGFNLLICTNVQEAVYVAGQNKFDIIVSDLLMPPPDGLDFLEDVYPFQQHALFVIFTAYPHNNVYRARIKELDFDVIIIPKSYDLSSFIETLFQSINKRWVVLKPTKRKLWHKIIDSIELKPGFSGLAVDLKKLIGGS